MATFFDNSDSLFSNENSYVATKISQTAQGLNVRPDRHQPSAIFIT